MQNIIVDTAENGQRAVELLADSAIGEYSAVLMDIQMPVMDGYEATLKIRGLEMCIRDRKATARMKNAWRKITFKNETV